LLGGFELSCGGTVVTLPLGAERVLAFLAIHKGALLRSYVAEALWPESHRRRASANLRSALWRIRQADHNIISVVENRLTLVRGVVVDLRELTVLSRRLLDREAQLAAEALEPELTAALSIELLPDWFDEWLLVERERWNQLRLHALEALAERLLTVDAYSQAVEAALTAVWAEPLRESPHRMLIRIYAAEGNPSEAVMEYQRYRQLLHRELKAAPTAQMEELIRALTSQR
jgi:DNA-binding SARP family transcriptional activator